MEILAKSKQKHHIQRHDNLNVVFHSGYINWKKKCGVLIIAVLEKRTDIETACGIPCSFSVSAGIQSKLDNLLCTATDALPNKTSRCYCSTV